MTQLAATVNATAELWTLDTLPSTQYVQVQDEIVEVRSRFPSQTFSLTGEETAPQIRVRRAQGGTAAASHNNGTALTALYGIGGGGGGGAIAVTGTEGGEVAAATALLLPGTITEPEVGQAELSDLASGVQRVRLLGPYPVTYQTAGIGTAAGAVITTLPVGVLVLKALLFTTTYWEIAGSENPTSITIAVADAGVSDPLYGITIYNEANQYVGDVFAHIEGPYDATDPVPHSIYTLEPTDVRLSVFGTLVQGAGNVQILIAEPA